MAEYKLNIKLIEKAIYAENPDLAFENLVEFLSNKGKTKTEIYYFLYNFYLSFHESEKYLEIEKKYGDHPLEIVMDRLWGYCRPSQSPKIITQSIN